MIIGDKIKIAREHKGLSREHLATVLNMDVRTYEKIENNKRDLHLSEVEKIAKTLEISPNALLFGEPMLVFQNCNENISLYNDGTINYHNIESIRKLYEEFILSLKQNIEQKDEIINLLRKKNG